jgi:hypothetical protein
MYYSSSNKYKRNGLNYELFEDNEEDKFEDAYPNHGNDMIVPI